MSISNFIEGLQKANYDPTAREIAEIIWLWVKTLPDGELELLETDKKDAQGSESNNQIYSEKNRRNLKVNIPELPAKTNLDLYPKAAADKYLPKTDNNKKERYPLQVPDAPAIPNKQELGIALKSLRRKFPSSTEQELNEAKTIDFFAEQKIWMPIKQPTLTRRWLDLVLVIEVNNSLVIWKQTIKELRKFLQSLGIFRHIETRGLKFNSSQLLHQELLFKLIVRVSPEFILFLILSSQNQRIEIFHYDDPQMRPYSPEFIGATSGKTLILLVSDLVSSVWSRPETYTLLQEWGRKGMVNLLQLLPERLWLRTNLGQQKSLKLNASVRLTSNQNLTIIPSSKKQEISQDGEFKLPVLCLDPNILEEWSKLLMGVGNNQSVGYGIKPDNHRYSNFVQEEITATERVERFQEIASPNALRLAEHLSAVLVTLPVIRVIQYTMLPQFNQGHVAEVLMGGLFKPLSEKITPNINPDEIEFEFFDGVRDELLSGLTVDEITDVIEEVSSYLAEKMGISLKEFEALLIDSSKPENKLAKQVYPLAQVQAEVLEKLGGSYAYFANQIRASNTGSTNEIKDLIEFETEIEIATIVFEEETKEVEIELQEWSFETPTVNRRGEIVERTIHKAFYFTQSLPDNVSLEMVAIPSGTFTMGSPESEEGSFRDERPQHDVTVPSFFMGKYPVTQGQWRAIASRTDLKEKEDLDPDLSHFKEPYKGIDRWQRPVETVSWYEVVEFCKRLSKLTGRKYRLPSEAEWEYACRAGTTTPFYFGETINTDLANYRGTDNEKYNWSGSYGDGPKGEYKEQTTPVGQFPANAFGLYDMHGNVWEWCADDSHDNYVGAPTDGSAWVDSNEDSSTDSYTRLRGGSWVSFPNVCRSAVRYYSSGRDVHYSYSG
ncbi:MAG: formylglycine-generating enzyme family protein, partial [Trichodesmium sp. ALOHA_ZT_67]|nr:formylglycine-generating enzyme family protein [Trichodesmium sp. ALOHA_ZT_67]